MDLNNKHNFEELADKWVQGTITKEEKVYFESWYNSFEDLEIQVRNSQYGSGKELKSQMFHKIRIRLEGADLLPVKLNPSKVTWYRLVAAVLFFVFFAGILYYSNSKDQTLNTITYQDVDPGGNKAFLTLADGKRIALTDATNGKLTEEQGVSITKTNDGELVYEVVNGSGSKSAKVLSYNAISTPNGGQYHITLPDGTHVWLNAASALKYPNRFIGTERKVELNGEAYFEVAKNGMPFIVKTTGQEVKVLGTHFNINSYKDEGRTATTLLEGSVQVSANGLSKVILKPNQESLLIGNTLNVMAVDGESAIAWKNGLFVFEDANLQTVMRQIGRWYDLEVEYRGQIPQSTFNGKISRKLKLSKVLDVLKYYKVNFSLEGKKIIVKP